MQLSDKRRSKGPTTRPFCHPTRTPVRSGAVSSLFWLRLPEASDVKEEHCRGGMNELGAQGRRAGRFLGSTFSTGVISDLLVPDRAVSGLLYPLQTWFGTVPSASGSRYSRGPVHVLDNPLARRLADQSD